MRKLNNEETVSSENTAFEAALCGDSVSLSRKTVDAGRIFGIRSLKNITIEAPVFDTANQYQCRVQDNYVFNESMLHHMLSFIDGTSGDALYLYGPSGCGKTSLISQIAARLQWPVVSLTINGRFELADLIGHTSVVNGRVVFVHGPLARAMHYGYILILNEIDLADAAELAGLNDVLEGRSLVVIQNNGEVIPPHPDFRLVVTANTCGSGSRGGYHGTQLLNAAFLDRFRFIRCDYMSAKEESGLLKKAVPELSDKTIASMVRIAGEIRRSHTEPKANHVYMSVPMSTRALLRWAGLTRAYAFEDNPLKVALLHSFAGRLSDDEREYVLRLVSDVTGDTGDGVGSSV